MTLHIPPSKEEGELPVLLVFMHGSKYWGDTGWCSSPV